MNLGIYRIGSIPKVKNSSQLCTERAALNSPYLFYLSVQSICLLEKRLKKGKNATKLGGKWLLSICKYGYLQTEKHNVKVFF